MSDTLGDAVAAVFDKADKGDMTRRSLASWGAWPRDDGQERLAELRRRDPAAFDAQPGSVKLEHGFYVEGRRAAAEAFRWNAMWELALAQRTAGETFTAAADKAITTYAEARSNAEAHGLLEAARKAAEKGAAA